eukprot:3354773-Rhodomonas_salina.1
MPRNWVKRLTPSISSPICVISPQNLSPLPVTPQPRRAGTAGGGGGGGGPDDSCLVAGLGGVLALLLHHPPQLLQRLLQTLQRRLLPPSLVSLVLEFQVRMVWC